MWEDAARLIRRMDDVFDDGSIGVRTKLQALFALARQVSDAVAEYDPPLRWAGLNAALGPQPLRFENYINDVLDTQASGAIPDWCLEWLRRSRSDSGDSITAFPPPHRLSGSS
jgi:hypothetical protein